MQTMQEKITALREKRSIKVVALHLGNRLAFDTLATVVEKPFSSIEKVLLNKNNLTGKDIVHIETADILLLESSYDFSHPGLPKTPEGFDHLIVLYLRKLRPDSIILVFPEERIDLIPGIDMQFPVTAPNSMEHLQEIFSKK